MTARSAQAYRQNGVVLNSSNGSWQVIGAGLMLAVCAGRLGPAIAQSDDQYFAVNGGGPFAGDNPDDELRALFSVHGEPFTVVARRDAGIRSFEDLPGKRVILGNPGSGQRATTAPLHDGARRITANRAGYTNDCISAICLYPESS